MASPKVAFDPAKSKRGREEGDGTENVINCRDVCRKLSWHFMTTYDDLWRFMTFYVNGIKRRKLSENVANCRDVCRKLSWRLSQIVVTFFFPSPSRRPLLDFADWHCPSHSVFSTEGSFGSFIPPAAQRGSCPQGPNSSLCSGRVPAAPWVGMYSIRPKKHEGADTWCMKVGTLKSTLRAPWKKTLVSVIFPPAIQGPEMAAPILRRLAFLGFFQLENPMPIKFFLLGGGCFLEGPRKSFEFFFALRVIFILQG